jgi:hypothetical protein
METFLIAGLIIQAQDFQEAGRKALRKLREAGVFKPRLGRNSFSRSLNEVEEVPVENLKTGEMDTVQFPKVAF